MFVLSYHVHGKQEHIENIRFVWSTGRTQVWNSSSSIKIAVRSFTVFWQIFWISTNASEQTVSPFLLIIILPISSATHRLQSLKITFIIQIIYLRSRRNKLSNHPKYWIIHLFSIENIACKYRYSTRICQYIKLINSSFFQKTILGITDISI